MTYDTAGRVTDETDVTLQGSDTYTSYVSNSYDLGLSSYALGAVTSSSSTNYKNGAYQGATSTATGYAWYDGAEQATVTYHPNASTTYTTSYAYAATGALVSAYVGDGRPRSVTVTNDALGQVIRRDEADNNYNATTGGDPHEMWYRFAGKQLGYIGNNGTEDTDYLTSVESRSSSGSGYFRGGAATGASYADFDQAYDPYTSYAQGAGGGSYTARSGDSLASVAAQLWGDASLWYKLAQANGMGADGALTAGQVLNVPGGVSKSGNNAGTSKPYNSADAYGDTSPTTPAPQEGSSLRSTCLLEATANRRRAAREDRA